MKIPLLKIGQVSVVRADVNTGHILDTSYELALGEGHDVFSIFDSVKDALSMIEVSSQEQKAVEFLVYDHNGECLFVKRNEG